MAGTSAGPIIEQSYYTMTTPGVFIYALCEPGTRAIRYIGKSVDPKRRLSEHILESKTQKTHKACWIRSLNQTPSLLVLKRVSDADWEEWERCYIANARMLGFDLVNQTEGGDGVGAGEACPNFGKPRPPAVRLAISRAHSGDGNPMYGRRGELNPMYGRRGDKSPAFGRKHSSDERAKMSAALVGEKNPMFGRKTAPETLAKLSAALSGANDPRFGKKLSAETKLKISEALRRRSRELKKQ